MRTLSTGSAASSKAEGNDESEMAALLRAGDPNGALATLARAGSAANVRMANMQFNALLAIGHSVEAAIEGVLATCTRGGFTPSQSICVNVLHALDKHSTPEAVLAWLARMREAESYSNPMLTVMFYSRAAGGPCETPMWLPYESPMKPL
jgi:hypothetical protein